MGGFFKGRDTGLWLYGAIRFALWAAVVAIAIFPTVWQISGPLSIFSPLSTINDQAHFRDLLFALVPAVALPISTTVDFLAARRDNEVEKLSALAVLLANIFVLSAGFVGFLTIPDEAALPSTQFDLYSWVLVVGMAISLGTEVWIAVANKRHHRLHERNWNELRRVRSRVKVLEHQ